MVKNDFFCYKITSSLILDFFSGSGTTAHALDLFLNNIKADRNDLNLLFGCMLYWGVQLSLPMTQEVVDGKIACARKHFAAISENGYIYDVVTDYQALYNAVTK